MRYLTLEISRFLAEESKMAFIAGPRQVGKTTLAKYLLAQIGMEALYFNWDIESHRKLIIKNPDYGRLCWPIAGTKCPAGARGTQARKIKDCEACEFFKAVVYDGMTDS
jgi:hypothetical protein